jgi:hypothetical protein
MASAWTMNSAEQTTKHNSNNIFMKACAKKLDKALKSTFRRKTVKEEVSTIGTPAESDDAFDFSTVGKFCRGDSLSTVDSTPSSTVLLPSLPGSVESDDEEDESLYGDACFNQPELKRIAKLARQRPCDNGQELSLGENCRDEEFRKEKAAMKALVKSFAKEARSGLKCMVFEEDTGLHVSAKLRLEQSLTLTLKHNSDTIIIPLKNLVDAYSSEDLLEHFPDSQLVQKAAEVRAEVFLQHQAPGFPASWVCLSFADEESKDRCIFSIKVLQQVAEIRQQRIIEHGGQSA